MNEYLISEISLDGYQVVKSQFFEKQPDAVMTLWDNAIAFGMGCFVALNNCESVNIMINEEKKFVIVKPVASNTPEAVSWKRTTKSEPHYSKLECPQLTKRIYEQWGYDKRYHYRAMGRTVQADKKIMLLFEFADPVVLSGNRKVENDGK